MVNKLGNDTGLSMDTIVPRCTTTMFRLVDPVTVCDIFRERRTPCRVRDGVSCQQNFLDIVLSPVHNSRPTSSQLDDLLPHIPSTTISALDKYLSSTINPDLRVPNKRRHTTSSCVRWKVESAGTRRASGMFLNLSPLRDSIA